MNAPYRRVITEQRMRKSSSEYPRTIEAEAQSDQARVLYSAPFRRLQSKAQVFALEPNAAVRSRLTHSLEVASIGRLIALTVLRLFDTKKESLGLTEGYDDAFVTFAETACLLHDIGNPPFGHYGELALSQWFTQKKGHFRDKFLAKTHDSAIDARWDRKYRDFTEFDGNPQGVRIVVRLQWHVDAFGLNLTATQLASMIKYPVSTAERDQSARWHKAGLFQTEESVQKHVWEILGLPPGCRHPLVMIMEAADDIGYCMSDIEDAIEKEVVSYRHFFEHMKDFSAPKEEPWISLWISLMNQLPKSPAGLMPLLGFRTTLARMLTSICARQYVESHDSILAGSCESLFPKGGVELTLLEHLKKFAKAQIYTSRAVRDRELVAYSVLSGLLDTYEPLLNCKEEQFEKIIGAAGREDYHERPSVEATLLSRFPRKHRQAYLNQVDELRKDSNIREDEKEIDEWVLRGHLILDYISGMTDDFAFEMHNLTSGVRRYGSF